jgi:hypothetical protein
MEGSGDAHSPHGTASPSSHLHSMHTGPSAGISAPAKLPLSEEGRAYLSDSGTSEDEEEDERSYAPSQTLAAAAAAAPNGHAHPHAAAPTANGGGSSNSPPTPPTQPAAAALHSDGSPTAAAAAGVAAMDLEDETLTIRIPASEVPTAPPAGVQVPQPLSLAEISALHSQQQHQQHNGDLHGSGSPSAAHSAAGGWGAAKAEHGGSSSNNSSSSSMHAAAAAPTAAAAASGQPPEEELPPPLPEPDVIVPCMLGSLAVEATTGDHVCSGKWGMSKDAHMPGGSVSPFEFRLTAAQLAHPQQQPPVTGDYAAFFIVKLNPKTRETVRH